MAGVSEGMLNLAPRVFSAGSCNDFSTESNTMGTAAAAAAAGTTRT